jgi:hypothetical protein
VFYIVIRGLTGIRKTKKAMETETVSI